MGRESPFFTVEELPQDFLRPGTERRSIRLGELQFMFISFDRPTVSQPHQHEHDSIIYVDRGEFDVTVGEESRQLHPGEGVVVGPRVVHGLKTDAGARLIEVWYPLREGT